MKTGHYPRADLNQPGSAAYSDEYYTPRWLMAQLGRFDLDPCAAPRRRLADKNWTRATDGLSKTWFGRVWMNPPYSDVYPWIDRFMAHGNGIALFNARPETRWFQRLASGASGLLFLLGRIAFLRPASGPGHSPVGSTLFAYGDANWDILRKSDIAGIRCRLAGMTHSAQTRYKRSGQSRLSSYDLFIKTRATPTRGNAAAILPITHARP